MKIAVIFNKDKAGIENALETIKKWAKKAQNQLLLSEPLTNDIDYVLALGGDGTMLRAAREVGDLEIPVMGINLGGLGFLTAFPSSELEQALQDLTHQNVTIDERMLLEIHFKKETLFALNDTTFNMTSDARVVELSTYVNNEFLTRFTGDGLIVATPTGSTAYSLSAGGPILDPRLEATILTPICPHALAARPVVVPPDQTIRIEVGYKNPTVILNIDGQERRLLKTGDKVSFRKAQRHARIVMPKEKSFFKILRHKMRWGGIRNA